MVVEQRAHQQPCPVHSHEGAPPLNVEGGSPGLDHHSLVGVGWSLPNEQPDLRIKPFGVHAQNHGATRADNGSGRPASTLGVLHVVGLTVGMGHIKRTYLGGFFTGRRVPL